MGPLELCHLDAWAERDPQDAGAHVEARHEALQPTVYHLWQEKCGGMHPVSVLHKRREVQHIFPYRMREASKLLHGG